MDGTTAQSPFGLATLSGHPAHPRPRPNRPVCSSDPLADGRLLILSIFPNTESRITADLATRRNELVAALADDIFVVYATPGGRLDTSLRQKPLPLAQPAP